MKSLLLHIVIIFSPVSVWAQGLRPEIENIVNKLAKKNELHGSHVGAGGGRSDQYNTFIELRDKAKLFELIALIDHSNSVVKGYASLALADRKFPGIEEVLTRFIDSGEQTMMLHGCMGILGELSSELYDRVRYQHYRNDISPEDSLFFAEQGNRFDSIIMYHPRHSGVLEEVLRENNANPAMYSRVKELALKGKSNQAFIELAKYKNPEDIELIKKSSVCTSFRAISFFPHEKFWPFLEKYFHKQQSYEIYLAIASFKNEKANTVLYGFFQQLDEKNVYSEIERLYQAMATHYDDVYRDMALEIWEKYGFMNINVMSDIIDKHPQKAVQSFTKGLLTKNGIRCVWSEYDYTSGDSILPKMLYTIRDYKSEQLFDICKFNVENKDFRELAIVLNFIKENKLTGFEELLIQRLSKPNIPYDIYHLTKLLLSYKNVQLQNRVIKILKMHPTGWKIGNWPNQFKELFEEYKIEI